MMRRLPSTHLVLHMETLGSTRDGLLLAFGAARFEYDPNNPCSLYPDVRRWWINPVDVIDHMGAIDIRVLRDWLSVPENHSILISTLNHNNTDLRPFADHIIEFMSQTPITYLWTQGQELEALIYRCRQVYSGTWELPFDTQYRDYQTLLDLIPADNRYTTDMVARQPNTNLGYEHDVETELLVKCQNIYNAVSGLAYDTNIRPRQG